MPDPFQTNRDCVFVSRCPKCGWEHYIPERVCDSIVTATKCDVDTRKRLAKLELEVQRREDAEAELKRTKAGHEALMRSFEMLSQLHNALTAEHMILRRRLGDA